MDNLSSESTIKIPYRVTSDIHKYEGRIFNPNPDPYYLEQKKIEIDSLGSKLGHTIPEAYPLVEDLAKFCGLPPTNDIREIALKLEEDVVILKRGRIVSTCFCFPSGFDPSEKMGQTFAEVHQPVADGEILVKMAEKISSLISRPGALYRRFVWTLTTSHRLSRHPYYRSSEPPVTSIESLYYRQETQIMLGCDDAETTFFFDKIDVTPFLSLPQEKQQRAVESLKTMSEAVLDYKGLREIKALF